MIGRIAIIGSGVASEGRHQPARILDAGTGLQEVLPAFRAQVTSRVQAGPNRLGRGHRLGRLTPAALDTARAQDQSQQKGFHHGYHHQPVWLGIFSVSFIGQTPGLLMSTLMA